ncbi:hypothetical protein [Pollutimonas harenae]|uniref:Uncharacterized protein n=1 Tax=Pollutimonas harenae TaxID=657015 RepID=A0A853H3T9_9BURK|nr:hypothetical protein [Pollutimonas harenae]NYT86559.1 hypothetical protein [Pollutimonas harenae]TEA69699.1 hypothetical protein ERD84_13215 [Pollutimonas harenae]
MNTENTPTQEQLVQLIRLLSCNDLDEHESSRIVGVCLQSLTEPEKTLRTHYGADAAKVAQYDPQGVIAFILFIELEDYFAVADTVDELYEQIVDAFEQPALPEYPYDNNSFQTVSDFYQWVDSQLLAHHDKYRLVSFGESYTNDFQLILVYREQAEELLSLCQTLGLQAELCE